MWVTQLLWVRNVRLKSRIKTAKNPIHDKVISQQEAQNNDSIDDRMVSTHGKS